MSMLHVGHEVTGGRLEAGLLLALTFGVIWLHVMLLGLFRSGSRDRTEPSPGRDAAVRRRRRERFMEDDEAAAEARSPRVEDRMKTLLPMAAGLAMVALLAGTLGCSGGGSDVEAGKAEPAEATVVRAAPTEPPTLEPTATVQETPAEARDDGDAIKVRALNGYRFDPEEIDVKAGEPVTIELDSTRTFESHSFVVDEIEGAEVAADAGIVARVQFTALEPGTYTFYCSVAGHREAGMVGTLVVK